MADISKVTLLDGSTYNIKPAVIDSAPVQNGSNPVTSGGVYTDQQRQDAEIGVLANAGAKNYLFLTQTSGTTSGVKWTVDQSTGLVTATRNSGTSESTRLISEFVLKAGSYVFTSYPNASFSTADSFIASEGSTIARDVNGFQNFTLEQDANIRISCRIRAGITSAEFKPMIRRAEIKDDTYIPYAPTNRDLYSNIFDSGTLINSGVDLDTLKTAGRYYIETVTDSASLANNPCTNELFYMNVEHVNGIIMQTIWSMAIDSATIYRRICKDNTWRSWFKFMGTEVST